MTVDEAILFLRSNPEHQQLVEDSYFDRDVLASAQRFYYSDEFAEVQRLLGSKIRGAVVVDLGAGTGIASYAFVQSGSRLVYAVEPGASDEVGRNAIARLRHTLPIEIIDAYAEAIPLPDSSVEIVYVRQVLHHIPDLPAAMRECLRILKPGGVFIACREHVVDNDEQKQIFLENHIMERLAGGENAYPLDAYISAMRGAGMQVQHVFAPWDSFINAFPEVRSRQEIDQIHVKWLQNKFGSVGYLLSFVPGMNRLIRWRFSHLRKPGRMYSFIAIKPL